ncbi:ATP-binding protein [Lactobacillaceae bacterium 24-114]
MMDKNPFNPSFGRVPRLFLDRKNTVNQLEQDLQDPDSPFLTTLIYGMRGSGKTTLLTDISHEMAKKKDWIVVDLTMNEQIIPTLVKSVYSQADGELKTMLTKLNGISLNAGILEVSYQQDAHTIDSPYQILLTSMAELLRKKHLSLLITIDEIQSTPALREFAGIYQILLRNDYHIALLMAGLPNKVSELQNDELLTFLLRSQRIYLEPLSLLTIKESYQRAFSNNGRTIDKQTLTKITKMTNGYAYAFQLLGYLLWRTGAMKITDEVVDRVLPDYQTQLYRNAYLKMYQELSPRDREFVNAMADSGKTNIEVSAIGKAMGRDKNYLSVYRRRLIDDQLITAPARGQVAFTLPYFAEFIKTYRELY